MIITESELAEARRRELIIAPLLEGPDITRRMMEAAKTNGVSRSTLFQWRRLYRSHGLEALAPKYHCRGGRGRSRLDEKRETFLQEAVELCLLQTKPTIRYACEEIRTAFLEAGLRPPVFNTVRMRIRQQQELMDNAATASTIDGRLQTTKEAIEELKLLEDDVKFLLQSISDRKRAITEKRKKIATLRRKIYHAKPSAIDRFERDGGQRPVYRHNIISDEKRVRIQELAGEEARSLREIAAMVGVSKDTVSAYIGPRDRSAAMRWAHRRRQQK